MRFVLVLLALSGCIRSFKSVAPPAAADELAAGSIRIDGKLGGGETSTTLSSTTAVSVALVGLSSSVQKYRLSNEPSFVGSEFAPVPSTGSVAWTLVPGTGTKTVYAQLQTGNGTVATGIAAQIVLDDRAPLWGARGLQSPITFLFDTAPIAASVAVDVSDDLDRSDALRIAITQDPSKTRCEGEVLQPYAATLALTLSNAAATLDASTVVCGNDLQGGKRLPVYACAVDQAGNVSTRFTLDFCLIGDTPQTALSMPLPLTAQPLQTGARVTWSDTNKLSERIEVQYSTSNVFADSDPSVFSGSGACKPRVAPPVTHTVESLVPGQRYYFRLRAIDCAGRAGPWSDVSVSTTVGRGELVFPEVYRGAQVTSIGTDLFLYSLVSSSLPGDERMHVGRCDSALDDCLRRESWHFTSVPLPFQVASSADRMTFFGDSEVLFAAAGAYDGTTHSVVLSRCPRRNGCDTPNGWTPVTVGTHPQNVAIESVAGRAHPGGFVIVFTRQRINVHGAGTHTLAFVRCDRMSPKGCGDSLEWSTRDVQVTVDPTQPLAIAVNDAELTVGFRTEEFFGVGNTFFRHEGHAGLFKCLGDCELPAGPTGDICTGTECDAWQSGFVNGANPGGGDLPMGASHTGRAFPPNPARVHDRSIVLYETTHTATGAVDMVSGKPRATLRLGACESAFCTQAQNFVWEQPLGSRLLDMDLGRSTLDVALHASKLDSDLYIHWIDGFGQLIQFKGTVNPSGPRIQTVLATDLTSDAKLSATLASENAYAVTTRDFSTVLFGPLVATPAGFFASPADGGVALGWRRPAAATEMTLNYNASSVRLPASVAAESYFVSSTTAVTGAIAMTSAFGEGAATHAQKTVPFHRTPSLADASLASVSTSQTESFAAVVDVAGSLSFGACGGACDQASDWLWTPVDAGFTRSSIDISADRPRNWIGLWPLDDTQPRVITAGIDGSSQTRIATRDMKLSTWEVWSVAGAVDTTIAPRVSIVGDAAMVADVTAAGLRAHTCDGLPTPGEAATPDECDAGGGFCPGGRHYASNSCNNVRGPLAGQRASDYCTQQANWASLVLPGTANRTRSMAARVHGYQGFAIAEAHTAGLSFWACKHSTAGNCQTEVDCSSSSNWTEVPLAAAPARAVDLLFSIAQADLGTAGAQFRTQPVMISFADTAWRVAISYGDTDPLRGLWFPLIIDNFSGNLRGRDWVNVYLFDARSDPLSSTLRIVNKDIVLAWQESQRLGLSVCLGGFNCNVTSNWRTSVIDTGSFVPAFGQILSLGPSFSLSTTTGNGFRLFAGGSLH